MAHAETADAKFVLLHGGYPFVGELSYMGSTWHNVYLDLTWFPIFAGERFSSAFSEWMMNVPIDRFCLGTDTSSPESVVGVVREQRRILGRFFAERVRSGSLGEIEAKEWISAIFHENPLRIYRLSE